MLNISDDVILLPFRCEGRIVGMYLSATEAQFKVRYYLDSEVREEFFYEYELERADSQDTSES